MFSIVKKSFPHVCALLVIALLLSSCSREKKDLVEMVVRENVDSYRQNRIHECMEGVYEKANLIVDSILLARGKETILTQDSIPVPLKPDKPFKPNARSPLDTALVKPLFRGAKDS